MLGDLIGYAVFRVSQQQKQNVYKERLFQNLKFWNRLRKFKKTALEACEKMGNE
jgi:hypothetical protein